MLIQILLATYNGEKYIKEQLESLFAQSFTDFEILVSDDFSSDATLAIIEEYAEIHPGKIRIIKNTTPSGGAKNNFFSLMRCADADYVMFCDQDDYWLPDKIKLTLNKMKETEENGLPVLVHTDLAVADKDLNITYPSFFKMQHFDKSMKCTLGSAIAQNTVTGCTVMINRELLELAKNNNGEAVVMHDWWLAILAAAFGRVGVVKKPTILYRQHGGNSVGAKTFGETVNLHIVKKEKKIGESLDISYSQGMYFAEKYKDMLPQKTVKILKGYCEPSHKNELYRIWIMLRYGFLKQSFVRKCAQIVHGILSAIKEPIKKILRCK